MAMKKKDTTKKKTGKKGRNDRSSQFVPLFDNTGNSKVPPLHQCDYFNKKFIGCTSQLACQRVSNFYLQKMIFTLTVYYFRYKKMQSL